MQEFLEIGQIVNTFGIKGMVKIKPFTDDINRFDDLEKIYIEKNKTKTYLGNACYFNIFYTWNDIKTDKKGYMDSSRKW